MTKAREAPDTRGCIVGVNSSHSHDISHEDTNIVPFTNDQEGILAQYLVIHTPKADDSEEARPPTQLADLAAQHGSEGSRPRWIRAWSPDLHDDRIFSLWEAVNAEEIRATIQKFGFLDNMDAHPVNVREWGPADVLEIGPNE